MPDSPAELKSKSVLAHRILAMTGSSAQNSGHVFIRLSDSNEMLARCRNNSDWSPAFVGEEAIHRVDLDGNPTDELGDYLPPPERFIGTEILKVRPDVNCVIHGHPRYQVLCAAGGVKIRAAAGNRAPYGPYGTMAALNGVPVYPRTILVASPEVGGAVAAMIGGKYACVLKGHGNVVVGRSVEEATMRAIQLEQLAWFCWQLALAGKEPPELPWQDLEEDLNPTQLAAQQVRLQGGISWLWAYYVKMLEEGVNLQGELGG